MHEKNTTLPSHSRNILKGLKDVILNLLHSEILYKIGNIAFLEYIYFDKNQAFLSAEENEKATSKV